MIRIRTAAIVGLLMLATMPAASANVFSNQFANPSFETPSVTTGQFVNYSLGQTFGRWTVVGPSNAQVSLISCPYGEGGVTFDAAAGHQFVDLTGDGRNLAAGVAQTVKTAIGTTYYVKFRVGNVNGSSSVNLQINGATVFTGTNSNSTGGTSVHWHTFSHSFVASTASTTITFVNGDSASDFFNGLDFVKLTH